MTLKRVGVSSGSGEQHHLPGQGQLRPSYLPFFQNDYRVLIIYQINKVWKPLVAAATATATVPILIHTLWIINDHPLWILSFSLWHLTCLIWCLSLAFPFPGTWGKRGPSPSPSWAALLHWCGGCEPPPHSCTWFCSSRKSIHWSLKLIQDDNYLCLLAPPGKLDP